MTQQLGYPGNGRRPGGRGLRPGILACLALPLGLSGCFFYQEPIPEDPCVDEDGDGFSDNTADCMAYWGYSPDSSATTMDCDDWDKATYPNAIEYPDGRDNDCDGQADENTVIRDDDHDGFTEEQGDCNDDSATIYPGAPEKAGDGVDNNCDGLDIPTDIEDPSDFGEGDPTEAAAILMGDSERPNFMGYVSFVGDLDGDGREDMAWTSGTGDGDSRVYVVYSPEGGVTGVQTFPEVRSFEVKGIGLPNLQGVRLEHGDLNGDGFSDLVIGDFYQRRISVFYGGARRSGVLDASQAEVTFRPVDDGAAPIGLFLSVPGDMDGDGHDELVIGQPDSYYGTGRALIFYGRDYFKPITPVEEADARLWGYYAFDWMGAGMFGLSDLDEDGYTDILISAPGEQYSYSQTDESGNTYYYYYYGTAYLLYGGPERLSGDYLTADAAQAVIMSDASQYLGLETFAAAAGDVDGDGHLDVALALPYHPSEQVYQAMGTVPLIYGTGERLEGSFFLADLSETSLQPAAQYDSFASSMAMGDVTGDGLADVVVAGSLNAANYGEAVYPLVGYVAVFQGSSTRKEFRLASEGEGGIIHGAYGLMEFVYPVACGGDVNQDGLDDVLVGSEYYPYDTPRSAVLLFHGGALP